LLEHIFISLPKLETERLILRKLEYSDKSDIFEYARNPKVSQYVLWEPHKDVLDTLEFLNMVYDAYNKNSAGPWGIQLKENNKIIGTIGFVYWNKKEKSAEIGYALSEEYWNKGITSEAIKHVIEFGFTTLNLKTIFARCIPDNFASIKILKSNGFKLDDQVEMLIKGKSTIVLQLYLKNNNKRFLS
jgi:ribosomal-protein-alanine N-acetyltransferase